MSGGSWDYFSFRLNDVIEALMNDKCTENKERDLGLTPEQKESRHKLGRLLRECSQALYEIEWVDSGDTSTPRDVDRVNAVFTVAKELLAGKKPRTKKEPKLSDAEEARIKAEKGWGWPFTWMGRDGWYFRSDDDDEIGPFGTSLQAEQQARNEAARLEQERKRKQKRDPFREVTHIKDKREPDGQIVWTLTLSCGHHAERRAGNSINKPMRARIRTAPKRVRCIVCGELGKD